MDARQRWQALQAQLTLARSHFEAGRPAAALEAVDAALAIDPDFLAAHSLRDRIRSATSVSAPPPAQTVEVLNKPACPPVSGEHYAQFEQRARRRRVDRRLDAARSALERGRLKEAASALDEVIELDPNLPELGELTAQFDALRRDTARSHRGRWLAAAAAFVVIVLGGSWLQDSSALWSRPMVAVAPLVAPPEPLGVTAMAAEPRPETVAPTSTTGALTPVTLPAPSIDRSREAIAVDAVARPFERGPVEVAALPPAAPPGPTASTAVAPLVAAAAPSPAVVPVSAPPPPAASPEPAVVALVTPDDEVLVKQVLQRYRNAYEGLDARSARAVWPAVNETALARAFDGLRSQTLTFDACDVSLRGEAAAATCRGSARYVPKIGNHDPRIEPRTWNFTLKKSGAGWTIESARADR